MSIMNKQEIQEYVRKCAIAGDVNALSSMKLGTNLVRIALEEGLNHDQVGVVKLCMDIARDGEWECVDDMWGEVEEVAGEEGGIPLLKLLCEEFMDYAAKSSRNTTLMLAMRGHMKVLKWWVEEMGVVLDGDVLWAALTEGNVEMAVWIKEKGVPTRDVFVTHVRCRKLEVLGLLHQWNIQGTYQFDCEDGSCGVCKAMGVWNGWWMESEMVENMHQWLPMEMVEDVLNMVV